MFYNINITKETLTEHNLCWFYIPETLWYILESHPLPGMGVIGTADQKKREPEKQAGGFYTCTGQNLLILFF